MTTPEVLGSFFAVFSLVMVCPLIWHTHKLRKLNQSLQLQLQSAQTEFKDLQKKFEKNPSYECQQLLANLFAGHALFHIETIDPENVFLRRR